MKKKKYIIAIDGPAGAGKSTVSKATARKLGYLYIDTGAMYRALALKAMREKLDFSDEAEVVRMAESTNLGLKHSKNPGTSIEVFIDGEDVTKRIRTEEISQGASKISAIEGVRRVLQEKQRQIGRDGGIVMEGRDIGTVVFPNADFKFYMDASPKERALRRYRELKAKGEDISLEAIEKEVEIRDERDKNRKADPLKMAQGSIYIDSTGLTVEETADVLVEKIKKHDKFYHTSWVYYTGRIMFRTLFFILWRYKVIGHKNIPAIGGVIIAPNHVSVVDPPLIGTSVKRPIHYMAKKELFDIFILGYLLKQVNVFPVRRGEQDVAAFRNAKRLLDAGEMVLVFPEGTRSRTGGFGKARAGVGMLSCMAQAPVVPIRVINTDKLKSFSKIKVIIGKPVFPPKQYTRQSYQKLSEEVLEEIKSL